MRLASEAGADFPYRSKRICYFTISNSVPVPLSRVDLQVALHTRKHIYAVWPGEWRSDMFLIDDRAALREAIGA